MVIELEFHCVQPFIAWCPDVIYVGLENNIATTLFWLFRGFLSFPAVYPRMTASWKREGLEEGLRLLRGPAQVQMRAHPL